MGLVVIAALGALCACRSNDPYVTTTRPFVAGQWRIEHGVIDRINGLPVSNAELLTRESATSGDLFRFNQPSRLTLLCFKQRPTVRFQFVFKAGSTLNASLGYRFDDRPGHEAVVRFLRDQQTLVFEDQAEVARFASQLATSKVLYVRIRALNLPRSSAEFNVEGGDLAVRHSFAGCPIFAAPQAAALH
jgi:hypothetical protein